MLHARILLAFSFLCGGVATYMFVYSVRHFGEPLAIQSIPATAILAASAGWLYNNFVTISLKIRERTFDYLQKSTVSREISDTSRRISKNWKADNIEIKKEDKAKLTEYFIENYDSGELVNDLKSIGNMLEEIAVAIKYRTVDESMIKECFCEIVNLNSDRISVFLCLFRNSDKCGGHPYGAATYNSIFSEVMWLQKRWTC